MDDGVHLAAIRGALPQLAGSETFAQAAQLTGRVLADVVGPGAAPGRPIRSRDDDSLPRQPSQLTHEGRIVLDVLDHVNRNNDIEARISEVLKWAYLDSGTRQPGIDILAAYFTGGCGEDLQAVSEAAACVQNRRSGNERRDPLIPAPLAGATTCSCILVSAFPYGASRHLSS